jgi:uncharacterized membrane protein (DUF2068 family)
MSRDATVVLIGVFRLAKAAVLVALGLAVALGLSAAVAHGLEARLDATGLFWARRLVARGLATLLSRGDHALHELELGCFAYAAVFTVEGVGLVRRRPWAEWVTVLVTSSFVPFEGYELARGKSVGMALTLVLNLAIVVYLVARIRKRRRDRAPPSTGR